MKILLLGKNGQVGWELQRSLAPLGELVGLDLDSPAPLNADFTRPERIGHFIGYIARPDDPGCFRGYNVILDNPRRAIV